MSLRSVKDAKLLEHANQQLHDRLMVARLDRWVKHAIGYRPATAYADVYWNRHFRFWFADEPRAAHHWMPFGVMEPTGTSTALHIAVEINTPRKAGHGCAGLFLQDDEGKVYLAHTGRVGGGRPGINRKQYLAKHGIKSRDVVRYDNDKIAILIGQVERPDLVRRIAGFVHDVAAFKASRPDHSAIDLPRQADRPFRPKFTGNVRYATSGQRQANLLHDLVVSELNRTLNRRGRMTGRRDLFVRGPGGTVSTLYEVKTDCSTTSVYTGAGQLLLNGLSEKKRPRLILVIPGIASKATSEVLQKLQIEVLTYRWRNNKPVFPGMSYEA